MSTSNRNERWKDCYNSSQKILLVGEGDFSFSACLARAFRTAENMVATSYLDKDWLVKSHWTGVPHLEELERLGCLLLYKVDVYKMHTHPVLKKMKFDFIIFNFPHAGHYDYLRESDLKLIEMHKELVGAYFISASKMLSEGGEVHIRHRDDPPYDRWDVVELACEAGLKLKEKVMFLKSMYPGYHHKRGGGINTNKTFPIGYACTFKFALDIPNVDDHYQKNDEVCVSEMKVQVHGDEVHAMEIKDEVHEALDDVHDALKIKDQVHHQKNDDVPNHGDEDQVPDLDDEAVSKMKNDVDDDVNVTEMEDTVNEQHEKTSDKVHDVHVLKTKDDIEDQYYDVKVDHISHMTDQVYGQHLKNDDEIPGHDDKHDVSELKEEVDDDDDDGDDGVHVLDMKDTEKNDQVHDVLEMSDDIHDHVHEHHDMRNDEVNVDLVHVLEKMNIVEEQHMQNEIHDEHNNIHVLEMKDHDHKQNTEDDNDSHEHKGFYLMDAIKDGDGNVSEMKSYVHDHHNIVGKKDGVDDNDGYLHDHQDHVNA